MALMAERDIYGRQYKVCALVTMVGCCRRVQGVRDKIAELTELLKRESACAEAAQLQAVAAVRQQSALKEVRRALKQS